ncbi:MAG: transglutaminase domain-containing protein [Bacteroidia bacterium]|nr:transglutaminase domain-containing protein [Bacteroidia bacterium]
MKNLCYTFLLAWLLTGCRDEKPLIVDARRSNDIERMLKVQKELTAHATKPIWQILDQPVSKNEELALKFLYAYMPLSDLADYSPEFMLANVRQSLIARKEMTWGSTVPEEEFLHFVLPIRVNNENLDSFRLVYYAEIKTRILGLGMKEAALEINHWCHEKVNYRGTDSRTSAPMSTISKTFGRCGEESTFTVTAMRTAGIPARQVYTPRWAHTDDNHAWVEVWIDGKWHFMGACEPDTDLDKGWFSEPSQRTMLIHTRTYGHYFGTEEVLDAQDRFSELNLTANYAVTKQVTVQVNNSDGTPADSAKVEFKLYNYAEFYPLATIPTDNKGTAKFTTGLGDLLVWASKDGYFAFKKLHVASTDTLHLVLSGKRMDLDTELMDMVPPAVSKSLQPVSEIAKKINNHRLATEDSIRNKKMATFRDSGWIRSYAKSKQLNVDTLMRTFRLSYGNWQEIIKYIEKNRSAERQLFLPLTYGVSEKDLSDTRAEILTDHLTGATAIGKPLDLPKEIFEKYVLAPRIDLEILAPWRNFLQKNLGIEMAAATRKEITVLTDWIKSNIRIDAMANKHSRASLTPVGVYNLRVADPLSRDIFFVAACRTFGIPARLNPETRSPEYFQSGNWFRAGFERMKPQPEMGQLSLKDLNNSLTPQYYLHFTLAQIVNGNCKTVEFEEGRKVTDFPDPILLETGNYLLVTGKRITDGSVLNSLTFFDIRKNQPTKINVTLRKEETTVKIVGRFIPDEVYLSETNKPGETPLSTLMKSPSSIIVLLDPDSEPSKHILNDLVPYSDQFNGWEGALIFVNCVDKKLKTSVFQNYKLPAKSSYAIDSERELEHAFSEIMGKEAKYSLPIVCFCNNSGEVSLITSGYRIGIGETLLQHIKFSKNNLINTKKTNCTTP